MLSYFNDNEKSAKKTHKNFIVKSVTILLGTKKILINIYPLQSTKEGPRRATDDGPLQVCIVFEKLSVR